MSSWRNVRRFAIALAVLTATSTGCTTTSPSSSATTGPATPGGGSGNVLAVKIDNVAGARPATGLGSAQVIYVAPVEGGLTRIIAVFTGQLPSLVGPVRSARETDIGVLGQYGKPAFAYSGAAPQILPKLNAASWVNAPQSAVPAAYARRSTHAAPHNLYVNPGKLPTGSGPALTSVLDFGAAPSGGTPTTTKKVGYSAAAYVFTWSDGHWSISMDGTPFTSTESGALTAATVVIQQVQVTYEPFAEDETGAHAPIAQTVGTGSATVLRDGQSFAGAWSRSDLSSPTKFTTGSGQDLPLATGPVWILLVPVNG
jgi:hypothetical protein